MNLYVRVGLCMISGEGRGENVIMWNVDGGDVVKNGKVHGLNEI